MSSGSIARAVALLLAAVPAVPRPAPAQAWNDPRVLALVRRATDRRVQQLADSGLVDYRATAHGYLTFLAQVGEGFFELPRVVKADELALEVYWRAPNLSKQRIVGRRDTTLLPTDIAYHRDHLGIVQNNFPAVIRIGDGDEVRDVPHPLSEGGLSEYDFAVRDSLRITIPGRSIDVYEVQVRPRQDRLPRVIGALYLDRENAQVVRMAVSFTRAAFVDDQLEDLFVVLENGLIESRFWLPRRQEIEIRRSVSWLDYPVRGIIRGRWDIGEYATNVAVPNARFGGPEIVSAPPAELRAYAWPPGRIADSLPKESRLPTPTEIKRVQQEARALVRGQAFNRSRFALAGRSVSDFIRFNRNSGLSLGSGYNVGVGHGMGLNARGRYGLAEKRAHGMLELGWRAAAGPRFWLFGFDEDREAGIVPERSQLVNSFAAQELGSDHTDLYGVRGWGVGTSVAWGGSQWSLTWAQERQFDLGLKAAGFNGTLPASFDADDRDGMTTTLRVERPAASWRGIEWRGRAEGRAWWRPAVSTDVANPFGCCTTYQNMHAQRAVLELDARRQLGALELASRTFAASVWSGPIIRTQDLLFLGGAVSAPGFDFHELVGDRAVSNGAELSLPVPFPGLRLGRFGRLPNTASLGVHGTAVGLRQVPATLSIQRGAGGTPPNDPMRAHATGWYWSYGVSARLAADLLRLDVSRPALDGRGWVFSFDVSRSFWSIM